jgi:hypothetical protein
VATFVAQQIFSQWQSSVSRDGATYFYLLNFFIFALRPIFFIRIIPFVATIGQSARPTMILEEDNVENLPTDEIENEIITGKPKEE